MNRVRALLTGLLLAAILGFPQQVDGKRSASGASDATEQTLRERDNLAAPATSFDQSESAAGSVVKRSSSPRLPSSSLGYYGVAGTVSIGWTAYDHQSDDRQQRQIVVGCNGNIHNVFTYRPIGGGASDRDVEYVAYVPGVAPPWPTSISPMTGGYGTIDATPVSGGKAVATWHYTQATDTSYTQCGMQPSCASTAFPNINYPFPPNCQGRKTGLGPRDNYYIWPSIAVDDMAGMPIAHILAMEYTGAPTYDTTGKRSLIYYKSVAGVNGGPTATCGTFIDSIYAINSVIVADPASEKVAIVYTRPRSWGNGLQRIYGRDNIGYRESDNLGASWGSFVRVTDYSDSEELIATRNGGKYVMRADEMSALYDDDNHLHIIWKTQWQDSATGSYLIYPSRLYHWDNLYSCISLIFDASNYGAGSNCPPGGDANNISKPSLTMCTVDGQKRFYAVYTLFRAYITADSSLLDCSAGKYQNGEVYVQGSHTHGYTWGTPINLTNTWSDGCYPGACNSENFTSAALYVTDSLRIQYLLDKDAGDYVFRYPHEGTETDNPVMNLSYPCFAISETPKLTAVPSGLTYPKMRTTPGSSTTDSVKVVNTGNASAHYSISVTPSASWLSFPGPAPSGVVPAGCTNSESIRIRVTGVPTEGLYKTDLVLSYEDGKALTIPVEMWNFSSWFLPQDQAIRTAFVRLNVEQTSRVAHQTPGNDFYFFGNAKDYLYDGSLIIGNSATNLSMSIFADSTGVIGVGDTLIGRLFALSNTVYDSTSYPSYRYASGRGCNRDTTIKFDCEFYAPKHVDSSNFMIGVFHIFAAASSVSNVTVAYAADWDIPDDSARNMSGFDETLQMVYQQGVSGAINGTRFGALAGYRKDTVALSAGLVLDNPTWVYPNNGYRSDSIWWKMQTAIGYSPFAGWPCDLSSVLVFGRGLTLTPLDTFTIYVVLAAQPAGGSLDSLKSQIAKAISFICRHVDANAPFSVCCHRCGDANNDFVIDVSDAVYLITYIFGGGTSPHSCEDVSEGLGDADGSGSVDISDAVYLITYIFQPYSCVPHCAGKPVPDVFADEDYLLFDAASGGTIPPYRDFVLTNSEAWTVTWSAHKIPDVTWMTMLRHHGSISPGDHTTVRVSITTTSLVPDVYTADIRILDENCSVLDTVSVIYTVSSSRAFIDLDSDTLSFQGSIASTAPVAERLTIQNKGERPLDWQAEVTYQDDDGWLEVTPSSGTVGGRVSQIVQSEAVSVRPKTTNLSPGTHNATITIISNALNGSRTVGVRYKVSASRF